MYLDWPQIWKEVEEIKNRQPYALDNEDEELLVQTIVERAIRKGERS